MWKKFLNGNNRINNYKVIIVYIYKSPDVNSDIFKYIEVSISKTNTTKAKKILRDNWNIKFFQKSVKLSTLKTGLLIIIYYNTAESQTRIIKYAESLLTMTVIRKTIQTQQQ